MTNFETRDFLNSIQIASPCKASWEAMSGDEKVRFCQQCKLHVYNISEMSTAEANKVISTKSEGKRVCVRLFRRADGTVLTQDCPRGLRIIRERLGKVWQRVGVLTLWWLSFAAQARAQDADFEGPAPSRRASIRELLVSPKVPTIISNSEVDTRTMDRSNLDRQAIMGDVASFDARPFMADLQRRIVAAWNAPTEFDWQPAIVSFTVYQTGKLSDLGLVRSCGDPTIDAGALKAITDAAPFSKLPEGMGTEIRIQFTFTKELVKEWQAHQLENSSTGTNLGQSKEELPGKSKKPLFKAHATHVAPIKKTD